jgi:hypothetical protein
MDTKTVLALGVGFALAFPAALQASSESLLEAPTALAWQGQGQGRGNDNARADENRGNAQARPERQNENRGNAQAAGRGNSGERGNAQAGQARGNSDDRARGPEAASGRSGAARARRADRVNPAQYRAHVDRLPPAVRRYVDSSRRSEQMVGRALARASLRGTDPARFRVDEEGGRIRVRNQRDQVLLDMDEERARRLGSWEMRRLGDRQPTSGSPAFCRSGEGHPVWGREWCLDKGFGLGVGERSIWSRATVDDVVFRRRPEANVALDRGGLIGVLGDIVFGRLAVQSLALGYQEPLVGRWVASTDERDAPFILRVHAGDVAVAEFVDTDRDDDVDILYVTQPRW